MLIEPASQLQIELTAAFPTPIGRLRVPDAEPMNLGLRDLILAEERRYPSVGHSNVNGWHGRTDFLTRPEPEVAALTSWITWAVRQMTDATAGPGKFRGDRVGVGVGDGLPCRRVPRPAHSPGQRVVRRLLRGRRHVREHMIIR